ncbi:DNA internalization-related competence protein ComEC/Rec2 [Peribacillus kribbensis]|uniref:DNA internalization-related competence protein ComEC/Rec2 n=1 Tax=Peribacillus kribbensis TaxID=356658 RepID=UPI00041F5D95|nr:DNA internalization-related competence protein ComEC/Rec2 [Peribacillus kribbensis]
MGPSLTISAVTATFAVTALSLHNGLLFILVFAYFLLLFLLKGGKFLALQMLIFLTWGTAQYEQNVHNATSLKETASVFRLSFSALPVIDGNSFRTEAKTEEGETIIVHKRISTKQEKDFLSAAAMENVTCRAAGSLQSPESSRNQNLFNYNTYLYHKEIHWVLNASIIDQCSENASTPLTFIRELRSKLLIKIKKGFPPEAASVSAALLLGESGWLDDEVQKDYQDLGIIHLLSISGLHVTLVSGAAFLSGIRMGATRRKMQTALFMLLPVYALLAGFSPPVIRSCGMTMLYLAMNLFKKKASAAAAIAMVYLALTLNNPNVVFDIGFQLTFAVTGGIILSADIIKRQRSSWGKTWIISLISQLCSIPIVLYHFFEVSAAGVFVNLLYIPLYSFVILPLSFLAFILLIAIPPISWLFISLLQIIITLSNAITSFLAELPLASLVFGRPNEYILLLMFLLLLGVFFSWDYKKRRECMWIGMALICLLFCQYEIENLTPYGEVTFIDVGQGDSILIRLPYGRGTYLIDTGGSVVFAQEDWEKKRREFDPGRDIVVPYLKSRGIRKLDKLILTHPDADHIGGAPSVLKEIDAKEVLISKGAVRGYLEKRTLQNKRKAVAVPVKDGDKWSTGKERFYILNPWQQTENTNDASIVIYAEAGGLKWMFTGDLGKEGEASLIKRYPGLKADILKAGHHGSKTSSSEGFVAALQPGTAVISAGRKNRYGHPNEETLEVLERHNIKIFRTDLNGAVTYRFHSSHGTFSSVLP